MKCVKAQKLLLDSRVVEAGLDEHVAGCPECAQYAKEVRAIGAGLASAPVHPSPGAVWDKITSGMAARKSRAGVPAFASAFLVLVAFAFFLWPRSTAGAVLARAHRAVKQTNSVHLSGYSYNPTAKQYPDEFRPAGWEHPETWIQGGAYRHEGWGGKRLLRRDHYEWFVKPGMAEPREAPFNGRAYTSDIWAQFDIGEPGDKNIEVTELGTVTFQGKQLKVVRTIDRGHMEEVNVQVLPNSRHIWIDEATGLPFCLTERNQEVDGGTREGVIFFEFDVHIDEALFEPASLDRLFGHHNGEPPPPIPPLPD